MDYAKAIQEARTRMGLSKRKLASKAGLDPSYITHLESGRKKPSLDALESLSSVLELPLPLLLLMSAEASDLEGITPEQAKFLAGSLHKLLT